MPSIILVDSSGLVVGTASVPETDLHLQQAPEGCTMHVGVQARPFLDRFVDGVVVPVPTSEPTMDERKATLLARLAERRWEIETGGVEVGGLRLETDDRSKLLIADAARRAESDPGFEVRWKTGAGWVLLSAPALIAARDAVFARVAACFAREAEIADMIAAADEATLGGVADLIQPFWPAP